MFSDQLVVGNHPFSSFRFLLKQVDLFVRAAVDAPDAFARTVALALVLAVPVAAFRRCRRACRCSLLSSLHVSPL